MGEETNAQSVNISIVCERVHLTIDHLSRKAVGEGTNAERFLDHSNVDMVST